MSLDCNDPEAAVFTAYQDRAQDAHDLPAGWTSAVDAASGTTYFCFVQTGQCQWEMPAPQHGGYH